MNVGPMDWTSMDLPSMSHIVFAHGSHFLEFLPYYEMFPFVFTEYSVLISDYSYLVSLLNFLNSEITLFFFQDFFSMI